MNYILQIDFILIEKQTHIKKIKCIYAFGSFIIIHYKIKDRFSSPKTELYKNVRWILLIKDISLPIYKILKLQIFKLFNMPQ